MTRCCISTSAQRLATLTIFLAWIAAVASQSECIQSYSPSGSDFIRLIAKWQITWQEADEECGRIYFGYNMIQRNYKNFNLAGCNQGPLFPIRMFRNSSGYYWKNRDGLEDEPLNSTELSNMDPATNTEYEFGAMNKLSGMWTLVDKTFKFMGCNYCDILKRRDLLRPVRDNSSTNVINSMWRYDVIVAAIEGTSNETVRVELAAVLKVPLDSITEIYYIPGTPIVPTFPTTVPTTTTTTTTKTTTPTTTTTTTTPTTTTTDTPTTTTDTPTTTPPTTTPTPTTTTPPTTTPPTTTPTTTTPTTTTPTTTTPTTTTPTTTTPTTTTPTTTTPTTTTPTTTSPTSTSTNTDATTTAPITIDTTVTTDSTFASFVIKANNVGNVATFVVTTTEEDTTDGYTLTTSPTSSTHTNPSNIIAYATNLPESTIDVTTTTDVIITEESNTTPQHTTIITPTTTSPTITTSYRHTPMTSYFHLQYRVTLPGSHAPLPPLSAIPPTANIQVVLLDNVGFCAGNNSWPTTRSGKVAVIRDPTNTLLVQSRECLLESTYWYDITDYDTARATWTEPQVWREDWAPCDTNVVGETDEETLDNIGDILSNITETQPLSRQLDQIADLVNQALTINEEVLAQNNSKTQKVVRDLETILTKMVLEDGKDFVQTVRTDLSLVVSDVIPDNTVVGMSITSAGGGGQMPTVTIIRSDDEEGLSSNSEVSTRLPKSLVELHSRLAFTAFPNSVAFIEDPSLNTTTNSYVLSVILTDDFGNNTIFPPDTYIDILFKPREDSENKDCAFWDFENSTWSTEGCYLLNDTVATFDTCRCNHLTNFAEIITGGNHFKPATRQALDIISLVGSVLSIIALSLIALTAICFKQWRQEIGNKILLHMTAAVALNLFAFILVSTIQAEKNGGVCIFLGVFLHYTVLGCMFWMLVMSALQMLRLLTMLGYKIIPRLLMKVSLFAWGVPLIPIVILLAIDPYLYVQTENRNFCYPEGLAFFLTVLFPITLIMLINITVFIVILFRLNSWFCWAETVKYTLHGITDRTISLRRLRTMIFLFILFGLTWVFGLFAADVVFAFLFCISATLQGVLLFVFLVLMERKTSGYWMTAVSGDRNVLKIITSSTDSRNITATTKASSDSASRGSSGNETDKYLQRERSWYILDKDSKET